MTPFTDHDGFAYRQMARGWRVPWDKQPLIDAKSETITQLPTFKPHLQNRCLILADGFFEKGIRFIQPGEPLFAMAGLWQRDVPGGRFTMLTTTPNASISPYHHRMPFMLRAEQLGAWLGNDWLAVWENPDRAPLDKIQKQPELFFTALAFVPAPGTTGRTGKPSVRPRRRQIRQSLSL